MRDIGKNIKSLRLKRSITQEELAEKLFVTRQTVSNYEIGRTRPDIDMLMKISEVLDADMNELLYGPQEAEDRTRVVLKTCISAGCLVLLVLVYLWLQRWARIQKNNWYSTTPDWMLRIFLKPGVLLYSGWTALQLLGAFFHLQPLPKKSSRPLLICALSLIGLYLLAAAPLALSVLFSLEYFNGWPVTVSCYVLGIYPGQLLPDLYLLLSFLAGGMLWLAGAGKRKNK